MGVIVVLWRLRPPTWAEMGLQVFDKVRPSADQVLEFAQEKVGPWVVRHMVASMPMLTDR